MKYWAFQFKDIGLYTELLESFGWDEERLAEVVDLIGQVLHDLGPEKYEDWMSSLHVKLSNDLRIDQLKILEKIIKLEIEKLLLILNAPEA